MKKSKPFEEFVLPQGTNKGLKQPKLGEVVIDHDHDDHHEENFVSKYIFSHDHKMIGKQFLMTAVFMGLVAMMLSILFRIQLAWPGEESSVLSLFLGDTWAPDGILKEDMYLGLVTLHGTIMVFFLLTGGLSGTFSNILIPLQLGARDMASGFMNMLSYWFFFLSSLLMFASLFIQEGAVFGIQIGDPTTSLPGVWDGSGPAMAGWTIYPPLSALPQSVSGSGLGMTFWLFSMTIFAAVATFIFTIAKPFSLLYEEINAYGYSYFLLSILLMLLIHDCYFYWMHRLMHHPFLYKKIHLVHHRSTNPSPWTAYAFHPAEAVIEAGILIVLVFVIPCHKLALLSFFLFQIMYNVYGHLGFELYPVGFSIMLLENSNRRALPN